MFTPPQTSSNPGSVLETGFFAGSFIRPGEERDYLELRAELRGRFTPADILEEALVDEIHRAIWRLRRCARVEAELSPLFAGDHVIHDPMEATNEPAERVQLTIDRARAQAHRILHRCTTELRKLRTERAAQTPRSDEVQPLEITKRTQSDSQKRTHSGSATARNTECPCGSRRKYKRCCGKGAPPLLFAG